MFEYGFIRGEVGTVLLRINSKEEMVVKATKSTVYVEVYYFSLKCSGFVTFWTDPDPQPILLDSSAGSCFFFSGLQDANKNS